MGRDEPGGIGYEAIYLADRTKHTKKAFKRRLGFVDELDNSHRSASRAEQAVSIYINRML